MSEQETKHLLTTSLGNRKYTFHEDLVPLKNYDFLKEITKVEIQHITDLSVVPLLHRDPTTQYVNIIDRAQGNCRIVAITRVGCFEVCSS
jgi:hypothetical protein